MARKSQENGPRGTMSGAFITFEGIDGVGKSTQCALVCAALERAGHDVVRLREPGGTRLGEGIRRLLLDPSSLDAGVAMSPVAELLLYEAARAQLVEQVIRPALERGSIVVSDRFFDSTAAYQGYARGLGPAIADGLNSIACAGVIPDRTILIDMPAGEARDRAAGRAQGPDRLESEGEALEARVREGFAAIAAQHPDRVRPVDGRGTVEQVYERVRAQLDDVVDLCPYEQAAPHVG